MLQYASEYLRWIETMSRLKDNHQKESDLDSRYVHHFFQCKNSNNNHIEIMEIIAYSQV